MKNLEYENWTQKYFNEKIVDFSKYLNKEDMQILEKLGIEIENRIYTEYEFDMIEQNLLKYYKSIEKLQNNDTKCTKMLINEITIEQYNNILQKFSKISLEYKI